MPLLTRRQSAAVRTQKKRSQNGEYYPIITQMQQHSSRDYGIDQ